MSNYIVFSSYYKHGETSCDVYTSFKDCFGGLVQSIFDFISKHNENLDEYEEEDEMVEEIKTNENYFNKYKILFETESDASNTEKLYQIFIDSINCSDKEFFDDVIEMNKVLYDNDWSVRGIVKVPSNSYSCWFQQ